MPEKTISSLAGSNIPERSQHSKATPRAGLAGGGAQNQNDTWTPKQTR
jgi:hypothetical protein